MTAWTRKGDVDASFTTHSKPQTLENKTLVVSRNTIITEASGNLKATELNAALAELQGDIDTRASDSGLAAVQAKMRESVSVKDFGAVGNGVKDDSAAVVAAIASGAKFIAVPAGTYNLNASTITLADSIEFIFTGGVLTNGTLACTNNFFSGVRGLSETITLTGTVGNEDGVHFNWFTCEKSTIAQYNTFINTNSSTYGAIPSISSVNRTILTMLLAQGHTVKFGGGIYPFDAEVVLTGNFRISGRDRDSTLLWSPNSSFLHFYVGGATGPYLKNIRVEANNSVIRTQANTVNAIHGLVLQDCYFTSYADHAFYNDYSVAGGTGCPIYGSKITQVAVYAGPAKAGWYGWGSGSNIYDNVVDLHFFFNGISTNKKGIIKAIFWNSNCKMYCNSNVSYSGFDYVFYADRPSSLLTFVAKNNAFEVGTYSHQAIVKVDAVSSNINLSIENNQYIGNSKENGYHYILKVGNCYLQGYDDSILYGNTVRNYTDQYVRVVTEPMDVGATKYRLLFLEPRTVDNGGVSAPSTLFTPTTELAQLVGMESILAADSANISYIEIKASSRAEKSRALAGGYGATAARPTYRLSIGMPYFDTTLGYPVWYNGTAWVNATGAVV